MNEHSYMEQHVTWNSMSEPHKHMEQEEHSIRECTYSMTTFIGIAKSNKAKDCIFTCYYTETRKVKDLLQEQSHLIYFQSKNCILMIYERKILILFKVIPA